MPRLDLIVVPGVALLAGIVIGALLYRVGATDAVGAMLVAGFITLYYAIVSFDGLVAGFSLR